MKGQAQIFAEFLGFTIGLIVTISIAYMFSGYLAPKLIDEAMNYHLDNLLKQVEASASQLTFYAEYFGDKTQTLKLSIPTKLAKKDYQVYKFNDKLCATVSGTQYFKCVDNNFGIQGSFVSGSRMILSMQLVGQERMITMTSD